jgi:hypothetical protein
VSAPVVRFVLWNLADSLTTIDELRDYLRAESVAAFERVPGLLFKAWIADETTDRWGAIYVWESHEAADQDLRSLVSARELIGKDPDIGEIFDVEATVSIADELTRLGVALES